VAASRRVVTVSSEAQLESTVNSYIAQGFTVQNRTTNTAVMYKAKVFSTLWAIVGLVLCVLPLLIYLIVYAVQTDQMIEITLVTPPSSVGP
jgi:uncharacterized membrane protein SpoIIM required for sporulation